MRKPVHKVVGASLFGAASVVSAGVPGDLSLAIVGNVDHPMAIVSPGDGSGRVFIAERGGRVRLKRRNQIFQYEVFMDLSAQGTAPPLGPILLSGEGGFLGMAFHPNFETNRQLFVHYTDVNGDAVVARYLVSGTNADVIDYSTAQVVIRVDQDGAYHKGGDIHFGPDGYLYVALGDGGSSCNRARTLRPSQLLENDGNYITCPADEPFVSSGGNPDSRALMGKILRLDVDATTPAGTNEMCAANVDGSANYAVPANNPYAGSAGTVGNCDEIWSWGLRNPFRFSIDRGNGDIFVADVGEESQEEVNRQPASSTVALDYGWNICEGTLGSCATSTPPILTYAHGSGCAVIGGYRYRGDITSLVGTYIFADYCTGHIMFAEETGGAWTSALWFDGSDYSITTFGEDEDGEVYVGFDGYVYRFRSAATDRIFRDGWES